jgi:hypothetical protein
MQGPGGFSRGREAGSGIQMHFVSQITLPASETSRVTVTRVFQQPLARMFHESLTPTTDMAVLLPEL